MYTNKIILGSDVFAFCMIHANSNEEEEVMGLLIGEYRDNGEAEITAAKPCVRVDKRRDRVEVSPEQLFEGMEYASKIGKSLVGWYHSHPHITVLPSHVDSKMQKQLEQNDSRLFGLIFGVYNEEKGLGASQSSEVIGFQAQGDSYRIIPIEFSAKLSYGPFFYEQVPAILENLLEEEHLLKSKSPSKHGSNNLLAQMINENVYNTKVLCILQYVQNSFGLALEAREKYLNDLASRTPEPAKTPKSESVIF